MQNDCMQYIYKSCMLVVLIFKRNTKIYQPLVFLRDYGTSMHSILILITIITCSCEVVRFTLKSTAMASHSCISHEHPWSIHLQCGGKVGIQRGTTNTDEGSSNWTLTQDPWRDITCCVYYLLSNEWAAPFQRTWPKHCTIEYHHVSRTCQLSCYIRCQFHIVYKLEKWWREEDTNEWAYYINTFLTTFRYQHA